MTPILALEFLDKVFQRLVDVGTVAVPVCVVFGVVFWRLRRAASKREDARREAWIRERRERRSGAKKPPPGRP